MPTPSLDPCGILKATASWGVNELCSWASFDICIWRDCEPHAQKLASVAESQSGLALRFTRRIRRVLRYRGKPLAAMSTWFILLTLRTLVVRPPRGARADKIPSVRDGICGPRNRRSRVVPTARFLVLRSDAD